MTEKLLDVHLPKAVLLCLTADFIEVIDSRGRLSSVRVLAVEEIDQEAVSLKFHSDDIRSLAGPVVVEDDIIDALASFARKVSNEPILDRGCILCFALGLPREVNAGPIEDVDPLGVERAAIERRTEQFRIDEERPVSEMTGPSSSRNQSSSGFQRLPIQIFARGRVIGT